jgi:prepilin-type N-terminal cleavage/methylation domain-containing protein/prepilin-type processing-associated H-X9-DG protein
MTGPVVRSSRGFSLLELLLAVAVIAVLAGLLLPALSRARSRVHGTACLSNLRQWGVATILWASENQDYLPQDGTPNGRSVNEGWYIDLPRALGMPPYSELPWRTNPRVDPGRTLWICPANSRRSNSNNLFHYCLNQHVNGSGSGNQVRLGSLPSPGQTVWLFDNGRLAAVAGPNNVHTNLHQRGAQFLFLDGHVQRFPNVDYWDFRNRRGRRDHPELRWVPE